MTAIEVRSLSFGYRDDAPLFVNLSTSFNEGELVAVTGPSGKGKSTLLYLLGAMLRPADGDICIDGREISRLPDSERASLRAHSFGFVFQDAALDGTRSVIDNVLETTLYRAESRKAALPRALALLDEFGVGLRGNARPGQVSGGQAQRIALCRALLHRPRILLADEPTGNLDAASTEVVLGALRAHAMSGAAVVVVTHDPFVEARCDRTVAL